MEFLFEFKGQTAKKRMALLKTMKPTTRFGETFQYSNMMVAAGGYVAAHSAYPKLRLRTAYRKAMKTRVFGPVGMKRTTFDTRRARRMDHATPHAGTLKNTWVPIPYSYEDAVISVGPAGGAWSNVRDMARYLLVELGRGKTPEGKRVVSEANLLARRKPQARVADKAHYGLALLVLTSRGITRIGHGGGTLGFRTYMFFMPEHGVGMTVMTNSQGGGGLTGLAKRRLLEILFDGRKVAETRLAFILKQREKNLKKFLARTNLTPAKAWIAKLAGTYRNPVLGKVSIRMVRGKGVFDAGEWKSPMAHRTEKDGVEKLVIGPPLAGLSFLMGTKAGSRTLTLRHGQHTYVFEDVRRTK
jgi:CubicO group peptidase (beta-lactamase class C family)